MPIIQLMKYLHANLKLNMHLHFIVFFSLDVFTFILPEAERYSNIHLYFDQKLVSAKLRNRQLTFHQ